MSLEIEAQWGELGDGRVQRTLTIHCRRWYGWCWTPWRYRSDEEDGGGSTYRLVAWLWFQYAVHDLRGFVWDAGAQKHLHIPAKASFPPADTQAPGEREG